MRWSRKLRLPGSRVDNTTEANEAIDWLRSRAHEVSEVGPSDDDFVDLQWLRAAVGDARLVALGEATHGTHEFFAMKLRLLQFLVRELGFTVFAIEASWAKANLVNRFVHTGEGDAHALLKGLGFWTWNTQEVLDLILWIREHNKDAPPEQAVSFVGFDVQFAGRAVEHVLEFLARVDPPTRTAAELRYAKLREPAADSTETDTSATRRNFLLDDRQRYPRLPRRAQRRVRWAIRDVHRRLKRNRERYVRAGSEADFAFALQSARVLVQADEFASTFSGRIGGLRLRAENLARGLLRRDWRLPDWGGRDKAMAENAAWLVERAGPNARIVLWAHNLHLMTIPGSMGSYLRKAFHDDLLICAFAFHHGRFIACEVDQRTGAIGPPMPQQASEPPEGSYEAALHRLGLPRFMVDLRDQGGAPPQWLLGPRPFRSIGATYDQASAPDYLLPIALTRQADMLVYFDESTPAQSLFPIPPPPSG